jgi:hypothetical protein
LDRDEGDEAMAMTEKWLITHKDPMRDHPPDILLTNCKNARLPAPPADRAGSVGN